MDGAILPPAVTRRTFNVTLDHLRDEDLWSTRPLGTLLDVERMRVHWRDHHGIALQQVSAAAGRGCLQAAAASGCCVASPPVHAATTAPPPPRPC